jgi:acetylornithine deacetylase/succinyl-diaminopimelate desuccinylase-like protein
MTRIIVFLALAAATAHADESGDARKLLEELVAIDTTNPPGNEARAATLVAERLRAAGVTPTIVEFAPGRANVIARLRGDGTRKPLLLLAHLDVVGAAAQPWTTPPFRLTERDGLLYGRGVLDDKGWAAIATTVFLELARTRPRLHRDVVLALTGDEESGGSGIRFVLDKRPELLGDVELALNEGGTTLLGKDGRVKLVALQTAEKTFQSFRVVAHGTGGHSSIPNDDNAIYHLARALDRIGAYRFPPRLTPTVRSALRGRAVLAPEPLASALRRAADAKDAIPDETLRVLDADFAIRALPRTTCVATQLEGGTRENALPVEAHAIVNCRLVPIDSIEWVQKTLTERVGDARVAVETVPDFGAGPEVPVDGVVPDAVARVARELYGPGVTVAAALGTGASDSRFLRQRGVGAYGVGLLAVSPDDARRPHGPDERAPTASLAPGVRFLRALVHALAE